MLIDSFSGCHWMSVPGGRGVSGGGLCPAVSLCLEELIRTEGGLCPRVSVRQGSVQGGLCPVGCLSRQGSVQGVSVQGGLRPEGVSPSRREREGGWIPSCGQNDIRFWKHYLPLRSVITITSFPGHFTYIETLWNVVKWSMKWPYSNNGTQ